VDSGNSAPGTNCTSGAARPRLPIVTIADRPQFALRGIMVDAARQYLALSALKNYVLLCRVYKLNHLHIHLTDDQAFTFPSTAYPEAAHQSSWKYSLEELTELAKFASDRGVEIVGEIDVPGHSRALLSALPEKFGWPSREGHQPGIVNFVNDTVVAAVQTLFDEVSAVFPGSYVHIGGDEVAFNTLDGLPEVQAAAKTLGLNSSYDLYRRFIAQMQSYAAKSGRELLVWEGFGPAKGQTGRAAKAPSTVDIPTNGITVTPFDNFYYPPPELAADGYKILNSAWTPLYIAGGNGQSPELIYRWNPWLFGEVHDHLSWWTVPEAFRDAVVGVKMSVWDTSPESTLCALADRVPAMSDRSWYPQAGRTYADYQVRVAKTTSLLAKLIASIPAPPPPPTPPIPQPPLPPAAGFTVGLGECRDANGQFGTRLERNGPVELAVCEAFCQTQGDRCDAYDYAFNGSPSKLGIWCGIWGTTFTPSDNQTFSGVAFTYAGGNQPTSLPVCGPHGGANNLCFHRSSIKCSGGGGGTCLPGCSCH